MAAKDREEAAYCLSVTGSSRMAQSFPRCLRASQGGTSCCRPWRPRRRKEKRHAHTTTRVRPGRLRVRSRSCATMAPWPGSTPRATRFRWASSR